MNRPKDLNNPSPWNVRIWDVDKGEWLCQSDKDALPYYGFDIRGGEVAYVQGMQWVYRYSLSEGHPLVWECSTGHVDKNGVEIYEGDIVVWIDGINVAHTFAVEWQENRTRFCFRNPGDMADYEDMGEKMKPYLEVIGNIHENKNLLKEIYE